MKKGLAFLLTLCLLSVFALQVRAAIRLDGVVTNMEWGSQPQIHLIALNSGSQCSIGEAMLYWNISGDQERITFGLTAHAPESLPGAPVGALLQNNGQLLAQWHNDSGSSVSDDRYAIRGAANFPDGAGSYFTMELELGCKSPAAYAALDGLVIQLCDPQGVASKEIHITLAVPETTTVTTTEKTTTTKTTTTKTTTTAKTTTTKTTTSKTTTTKLTTTKATTTKTAASKSTAAATTAVPADTAAPLTFAASQPTAAPPPAADKAQAPQYSVGTTWYTVILAETVSATTTAPLPPLTFAAPAEVPTQALAATEVLSQLQSAPAPATQNSALLFVMAALLLVLALVLVLFWLNSRKAEPKEG